MAHSRCRIEMASDEKNTNETTIRISSSSTLDEDEDGGSMERSRPPPCRKVKKRTRTISTPALTGDRCMIDLSDSASSAMLARARRTGVPYIILRPHHLPLPAFNRSTR